jgi:hypothetical protein
MNVFPSYSRYVRKERLDWGTHLYFIYMVSPKNIVAGIKDVPEVWVYSQYARIPLERFDGQSIKIFSLFNTEKTPSMVFYYREELNTYRYKDFSSGNGGNAIDLVMKLHNLSYYDACYKIEREYEKFLEDNKKDLTFKNFKTGNKYKVGAFEKRNWNSSDKQFWTEFNIGSKLLESYNVFPLNWYTLVKDTDSFSIHGECLYGYFKNDGTLVKIYQPNIEKIRFIKVTDYIQGSEQCEGTRFLFYVSSMKDILGLRSLGINEDMKAPDSENSMISESTVKKDLEQYDGVFCIFDVDDPGVKAAKKYYDKYGIEPIYLSYGEKDPTDHIRRFGANRTRNWIVPLIDVKISGIKKSNRLWQESKLSFQKLLLF